MWLVLVFATRGLNDDDADQTAGFAIGQPEVRHGPPCCGALRKAGDYGVEKMKMKTTTIATAANRQTPMKRPSRMVKLRSVIAPSL